MVKPITDAELMAMRAQTGGQVAEQVNRRLKLGRYADKAQRAQRLTDSQPMSAPRPMTAMDHFIQREQAQPQRLSLRDKLGLLAEREIGT